MKRVGNLFSGIIDPENLRLAFWKASKGKRHREDQRHFQDNLEDNLAELRQGLVDGNYPIGEYRQFTIFDPKERVICAASFPERVLHHALMNVCEPYFDKWLIFDSYACRKGKGQLAAVNRAKDFAGKFQYYLKCDFRKYFDTIPHRGLKTALRDKIKDESVIYWFDKIIDCYCTESGTGLPIGNLSSQHFANLYLDGLDRKYRPYVRYMDDFVIWGDSTAELRDIRDEIRTFSCNELGLELKNPPHINRTEYGMDFLGMRVFPCGIALNRQSRSRYQWKVKYFARLFDSGVISEREYQLHLEALTAFTDMADFKAWRKGLFRVQ